MLSLEERRERQKIAKRKYRLSEKGQVAKQRDEEKYRVSGKRLENSRRREARPISPARKAARKRWAQENRWYFAADRAHRRMLAKYPVPAGDKVEMDGMYLFCQVFPEYEVDHIIPIKGSTICGLHVLRNLQVLPRSENRRKANKFCPAVAHMGA